MHDVENVLSDTAFRTALVVAAILVAVVVGRARYGRDEPGVLIAVVAAGLVGLRVEHRLPAALVVGVVVLVLGEWVTRDHGAWVRATGSVPGALLVGVALPAGWPFWIRAVVVGSTVVGGSRVERAHLLAPRLVPALVAIGGAGVYLCVPDTEAPKALLGALLAGGLASLSPRLRATLGAPAFTGLFVWIAGYGGLGRPGSVVGGVASLGVVLLAPRIRSRAHAVVVVATQGALVLYVARVAGFEQSAWSALALCVPAFAAAGLVLLASAARRR